MSSIASTDYHELFKTTNLNNSVENLYRFVIKQIFSLTREQVFSMKKEDKEYYISYKINEYNTPSLTNIQYMSYSEIDDMSLEMLKKKIDEFFIIGRKPIPDFNFDLIYEEI